jgi:hypothetical protein
MYSVFLKIAVGQNWDIEKFFSERGCKVFELQFKSLKS